VTVTEEKPYSERTTSSEPSEMENDDEERRELEQQHMQLVMEEEELLAIGQLSCCYTSSYIVRIILMFVNPLTPTVAIWVRYSYETSCARPG